VEQQSPNETACRTRSAPRQGNRRPGRDRARTQTKIDSGQEPGTKATLAAALLIIAAALTAQPSLASGPWRADAENTRGWQLMTPEERLAHQTKIREFESYQACRAYQLDHHRLMAARAREQGRKLAAEHRDFCAHLKPTTSSP